MFNVKYLIVVALLLFCLFCQQAVEARFLHKVEHDVGNVVHKVDKVAHKVDKVMKHVDRAKDVIAVGGAVVGIIGAAAATV